MAIKSSLHHFPPPHPRRPVDHDSVLFLHRGSSVREARNTGAKCARRLKGHSRSFWTVLAWTLVFLLKRVHLNLKAKIPVE